MSETRVELEGVAESRGRDLGKFQVLDLSAIEQQLSSESQNTMFHPSEIELNQTVTVITDEVERASPQRVAFDSMSEMRLLAQSPLRFRRQMLALKQCVIGRQCTVLFLDDNTSSEDYRNMQSLVNGVIRIELACPLRDAIQALTARLG